MCSKPKAPKPVAEKPVQYLRNPFLDKINIGGGRNSLRIDLGSNDKGYQPPNYSANSMGRNSAGMAHQLAATFFGGGRRSGGGFSPFRLN
jgi:hypothetical protein